jgi:hypothetical protein
MMKSARQKAGCHDNRDGKTHTFGGFDNTIAEADHRNVAESECFVS